jgi:hypothetical protein
MTETPANPEEPDNLFLLTSDHYKSDSFNPVYGVLSYRPGIYAWSMAA